MKVIIKEEIKLGSGSEIYLYKYKSRGQFLDMISQEADWLGNILEDKEVFEDEAHVYGGDYTFNYYIREMKE